MHDSSISTRACLATQRNVGGQRISLWTLDVDVHLFRNFFFFLAPKVSILLNVLDILGAADSHVRGSSDSSVSKDFGQESSPQTFTLQT